MLFYAIYVVFVCTQHAVKLAGRFSLLLPCYIPNTKFILHYTMNIYCGCLHSYTFVPIESRQTKIHTYNVRYVCILRCDEHKCMLNRAQLNRTRARPCACAQRYDVQISRIRSRVHKRDKAPGTFICQQTYIYISTYVQIYLYSAFVPNR